MQDANRQTAIKGSTSLQHTNISFLCIYDEAAVRGRESRATETHLRYQKCKRNAIDRQPSICIEGEQRDKRRRLGSSHCKAIAQAFRFGDRSRREHAIGI